MRSSSRAKQLTRRTHRTRRIWVSEEILDAPAVDRASIQGHEGDLVALKPRGEASSAKARLAPPPQDVEGES